MKVRNVLNVASSNETPSDVPFGHFVVSNASETKSFAIDSNRSISYEAMVFLIGASSVTLVVPSKGILCAIKRTERVYQPTQAAPYFKVPYVYFVLGGANCGQHMALLVRGES